MRRFFAPKRQFDGGRITLGPDETRHLRDVLRLREGEIVKVFDGEGSEYRAEIVKISKSGSELRAIEQCPPAAPESGLDLTLATAILKGEKFDLVVQKAVELGVKRLVPLFTARSDVKPKGTSKRTERWSRIALEAAKQSGRAALMGIDPPVSFDDFVRSSGKTTCLMFSEREGENFPSYPNLKENLDRLEIILKA